MPYLNTGQDVAEALLLIQSLFPLSVGEPMYLPVQLKTCSVEFVVASTGAPLQRKEITSSAVQVCSFRNLIIFFVSEIWGGGGKEGKNIFRASAVVGSP